MVMAAVSRTAICLMYENKISFFTVKAVVHFLKKLLLIIYSPPCHPRCPCLSLFSRKKNKVFDENIPGFSPYNGVQWEPNCSRSKRL